MNSKKQLTFEEYKKLSDEKKSNRYVELTDKDKFIARTSCYIQPVTVGYMSCCGQAFL